MIRRGALAFLVSIAALAAPLGDFDRTVVSFVKKNCAVCHSEKLKIGGVDLESAHDAAMVGARRDLWERAVHKVKTGEMPPKGIPRPNQLESAAMTGWLEREFARLDRDAPPDPGRVTARRLNRAEYNNTVRDLTGVAFKPAEDFPADDAGYGFDNIGDVLSLSPVLMEKYLAAAEKIARAAVVAPERWKPTIERYQAERMNQVDKTRLTVKHNFPVAASYDLRSGWGARLPDGLVLHSLFWIDGKPAKAIDVEVLPEKPRAFEGRLILPPGQHEIMAGFTGMELPKVPPKNEWQEKPPKKEKDKDAKEEPPKPITKDDIKPVLEFVEVRGPFEVAPPQLTEAHRRVVVCGHDPSAHDSACARKVAAALARRAYRRPPVAREVDALDGFIRMAQAEGDSFEHGVRLALQAALVSPHFLYRIERGEAAGPYTAEKISEHALASRLSYFLWSSMPDEELLRLAEQGRLRQNLSPQVRRMLRDPRSRGLVENFGGQWLQTRNLDTVKPDPQRFPNFDEELRAAMREETYQFFGAIIKEDRSVLDFLDGRFTYLNERLARHYGIESVKGPEFRLFPLARQRSGVLTQASVLTVTSYPARTSPVSRGKWILENILNAPPPPPPPNTPNLNEDAIGVKGSLRQQFEQHRSNPVCASCHTRMDPMGFSLENYDAVGAWRTKDGPFEVDPSGTLPNGKTFRSPAEMKQVLKLDHDAFAQCLTEKMLTYALGRGLERYDRMTVRSISRRLATGQYRFSELILGIVESLPFQMRRVEGGRS